MGSIYRCCVMKQGVTTCIECDEYPCERYVRRAWGTDQESRVAQENLERIKRVGLQVWLEEQRERRLLVEELLDTYNEGRSMSFYCRACTLMSPNLVSKAVDEARQILANNQADDSDIKAKAKTVKLVIQDLAAQCGIELRLGKKSK